ncbi:MAG: GNAT family N-acetyltransferase [Candidatus Dormibacteraeota bacterium]|nr:GNAT family N-acetyltransferase [Candidatus Dormibacteraeota bacterium]
MPCRMELVRRARLDEASELAELYMASRRESLPYLPEVHDAAETLSWMARQILSAEVWVAERRGRVAALMVLLGSQLDQLYVAPEHQGSGLGGRLVDLAKQRRPTGLTLWTFQRNSRARAFYERRGFRPQEFTAGDNEEGEPDVRYEWRPAAVDGSPPPGAE